MLEEYPCIRPDEHRAIGDIVVSPHPRDSNHRPDQENDARPNKVGNTKPIPADTDEEYRDIGDCRDRDPPEVNAERRPDEEFLERGESLGAEDVGNLDEKHEERRHDEDRKTDSVIVPRKYPGDIGERRGDKERIDFPEDVLCFLIFIYKLIQHIPAKQEIDQTPNGKGRTGGSKKIGIGIRYLARRAIVDRQTVRQEIHHHHSNIRNPGNNFYRNVFHN